MVWNLAVFLSCLWPFLMFLLLDFGETWWVSCYSEDVITELEMPCHVVDVDIWMVAACINSLQQEKLDVGLQVLCTSYGKSLWLLSRNPPVFLGSLPLYPLSLSLWNLLCARTLCLTGLCSCRQWQKMRMYSLWVQLFLSFCCIPVLCWEVINLDFGKLQGLWWAVSMFAEAF